MAQTYRLGIIGTGRPHGTEGATGFGMAHEHIRGYKKTGRVELSAIADIKPDVADLFAEEYGAKKIYSDYREMLAKENLDIVCVTLWPHLHAEAVIAAAEAKAKAVDCEKPMAMSWGDAKRMVEACEANGVQLTINHQRRFLDTFRTARKLIKDGLLGKLVRMEAHCGDMFDWGTHWLNMMFYFNDEIPAEWVIGQIDYRSGRTIFGAPNDDQAICHFKFQNGVHGFMITGYQSDIGCSIRVIGEQGVIELGAGRDSLRVRLNGAIDFQNLPVQEGLHSGISLDRAMADVIHCLDTGDTPLLSARTALNNTEVIFATYESARRRGRVDLPLDSDDSAILDMIQKGQLAAMKSKV
jgi:predicted dehydrogenase